MGGYLENYIEHLEEEVQELAKNLNVPAPAIEFVPQEEMPTPTSAAELVISKDGAATIYLNDKPVVMGLPLEMRIMHEMRHLYQVKYIEEHNDVLAKEWKRELDNSKRNKMLPLERYNLQRVELDANGYMVAMTAKLKRLHPQTVVTYWFSHLSDRVMFEIEKRARGILESGR